MGRRGFGRPWGQYIGLLVLALGTVALIYLALTRDSDEPTDSAADPSAGLSSSVTGSRTAPTESVTDDPTEASETPNTTTPPTVPDQRRADFTAGDELPDGALLVDGGGNESGLVLTNRGLVHGNPTRGALAAGVLEVKLDSDVNALGARVRFAKSNPGSVTLVAWKTSIAAAVEAGSDTAPPSGFRLVATPGRWTLSVINRTEDILAQGTYEDTGEAQTFQIVRDDTRVFVTDPSGAVTVATDPRVAEYAGPWASWGLSEYSVDENPATIESVWGG